MTLLALLCALVAVAFLLVVAIFATHIVHTLEAIGSREPSSWGRLGGSTSLLSRIWFGVRAIETQVGALPPQATRLNENLANLAQGLGDLKASLAGALEAVQEQRR
ncbi:hypothetical protein BH24DEI1_BH24DEI1_01860 [soil metagenome]|nr:hypothetical protein [Deinococcota bacterium]